MDGPRCPFYPSCAAYADRAIRTHGFLGLLLLIDRLAYRESGGGPEKYMKVPFHLSHDTRYFDPLSDFPDASPKPSLLTDDFGP